MRQAIGALIRPWTWSWRGWLILGQSRPRWLLGRPAHLSVASPARGGSGTGPLSRAQEARDHLDACLKIWPNDPQALLLASGAARRLGDFAAAEQHLRTLERVAPDAKDALDLEWSLVRPTAGAIDDKIEDFLVPLASREPALAPAIWEALIEGYVRIYRIREAFLYAERWLVL